ncbi:MAG: DUF2271 domain-containing protein [Acidobacteria bacterium]|nr:DUF2271 domain-containing protein [Acidobacteriota bacterium]
MNRKRFLSLLTGSGLLSSHIRAAATTPGGPQAFVFAHENVLGTSLELKFTADTPHAAEKAEAAALAEIDRLNLILSRFHPHSEFRQWLNTAQTPKQISPDLFRILYLFDTWRDATAGALDASAEALSQLWRNAASVQRLPDPTDLAATLALVRAQHWRLHHKEGAAQRLTSAPLALHSFAKSYIVERAAEAAMRTGVHSALVNIGGDLVVRGNTTEPVAIADPRSDQENGPRAALLNIANRAVATSGNYRRGVEIAGVHYSHILDPRTGYPVEHILSSTVVAPSAVDAGALATAFSVLSISESEKLAQSRQNVEYLLIAKNGRQFTSPGWAGLAAAPAQLEKAPWDSSMELTVQFELARIDAQRFRRPFIAIWIEDKDRFPVRTIALWFDKPRWLPDLKAWSRADRMRSMAEGTDLTASVSSATRPPGKYSVKWDGKDHHGKPVRAGLYTVFIEAAREHGTYQLIRQEMEFSGKPKQVQLTPNAEIASASLDYRKTPR